MEYNMKNELLIPISPGEMIDKITILQLKSEKIEDDVKLQNVLRELDLLQEVWINSIYCDFDISEEKRALYNVNLDIWNIEDGMRDKERTQNFDDEFIEIARREYKANDLRAKIKKTINNKLGSYLSEEKSYQPY